ncbi:hypothetical protein DVK44_14495 [Streptomyces paludis]|uniref:Uncharacterized protein n=1 Tax=Streptomyces paludis TaxID=2282738 RepID=A0A345HPU7_9ACTN|nr:hypothetical protein DVK44_14495 [Streptomyces paludis]
MALLRTPTVHDHVALAEIEWCGELMIAASATDGERLSPDRIDEVLNVRRERGGAGVGVGVGAGVGVGGGGVGTRERDRDRDDVRCAGAGRSPSSPPPPSRRSPRRP